MACDPVSGVDGHAQRPQVGQIDQRTQEFAVLGQHVAVGRLPTGPSYPGTPAITSSLTVDSPVSSPDGLGAREDSLICCRTPGRWR